METNTIDKEFLDTVTFASEEVLTDATEIKLRAADLRKAETLGNGYKGKVKIHFQNASGIPLNVHTTVWAAGDKYITVKGNRTIPVKSILKVEF
jgi:hypothetical protein